VRVRHFDWEGAYETALAARVWALEEAPDAVVSTIEQRVLDEGDVAVMELTARFDAIDAPPESLLVDPAAAGAALAALPSSLRESLEVAAGNVRAVAEAQVEAPPRDIALPQGQSMLIREVPVGDVGVYAPGGRAAYPSSVLMCSIPAKVAGVESVALASPPNRDGQVSPLVLAAAALCEIDTIYAMGGAQAIFALAHGTETVDAVDVIVGPGNAWVREAKRAVAGVVGIDSLAGPSELMAVVGPETNPQWVALDLCAQAEHGAESPLVLVAEVEEVLDQVLEATDMAALERPSVANAPLALVQVPGLEEAVELVNAYAPEHLELLVDDAATLAASIRTAGCVFAGQFAATAFGDYVAGSNHVLPTGGAGRFSGPLNPSIFRRKIATVEVPPEAAAKLAPHVDTIARAEGFPVHGESAMIRTKDT
jgi:histidinol dehydrogenase